MFIHNMVDVSDRYYVVLDHRSWSPAFLAKEGDVITLAVTVDSSGAKERRKNVERLMDDLFE